MADYQIGDIVVLTAGSMRMAVEGVEGDTVSTVWCNEGVIGRDQFDARLLKKWEHREENNRGGKPGGFNKGGDRGGFNKGGDRGGWKGRDDRGGDRDERPRGKTGWDGKPRENKFFRKD